MNGLNDFSETDFARDVREGLSSARKYLSSKYFYDQKGDALFQEIMELPEYYPTACEFEILDTYKEELGKRFAGPEGFDLIELGVGDGTKTKILLKAFLKAELEFTYRPTDISENALQGLVEALAKKIPTCRVLPKQGNYYRILEQLSEFGNRKKVLLFLGSNLGNFSPKDGVHFLTKIGEALGPEDLILIGLDQMKDPNLILNAYNDPGGVTAAFNLNLLRRINRELGADFDLNSFSHWPLYDPISGEVRSYLISEIEQEVTIKDLNLTVHFRRWEAIFTEFSRKYNHNSVSELAEASGLELLESWSDKKEYFKNYLFKKDI